MVAIASDNKMSNDKPGWFIVVSQKSGELRLFFPDVHLSRSGVVIGRSQDCDITIDDPYLSGQHCRLQLFKGKLQVTDVGSKNGVFVAEKRLGSGESATLAFSDRFRLGGTGRDAIEIAVERTVPQDLSDGTLLVDDDDYTEDSPPPIRMGVNRSVVFGGAASNGKGLPPFSMATKDMPAWSVDEITPRGQPQPVSSAKRSSPILIVTGVVILAAATGFGGYTAKNYYKTIQKTTQEAVVTPPTPVATHPIEATAPTSGKVAVLSSAETSVPIPLVSPTVKEISSRPQPVPSVSALSTIREIAPGKKRQERIIKNTLAEQYRAIDFGNYSALVIGNNEYRYVPKLDNAVQDAEAVADSLVNNYGFSVTMILNGSRSDTLSTLDRMRGKLTQKDNLLIFFAGHGIYDQASDRGYWLPVDAQPDTRANWISNTDITDSMKAIQAKHILVVADSCYSGTLTRSVMPELPSPSVVERINGHRSRTVLASGGIEPVVDGGGASQHSIFTSAFLDALKNNTAVIDGSGMFGQIRDPVRLNADQMPTYADIRNANHEIGGDFLFVRR
ncbi:hypothetical protein CCP3SC1_350014 [Gammaproteobacteria bacterium]